MPLRETLLALTSFPAPFLEQGDGTLTLDFVAAERKSSLSRKKVSYHCRARIDEKAMRVIFFEMLKEKGAGISSGDEPGPGFNFKKETYNTLGDGRSGTLEESSRLIGKGYSLSFDYGQVRDTVRREAEAAGYAFDTTLRESQVSKRGTAQPDRPATATAVQARIKPSKWYYALACLILIAGMVAFGLSLAGGIQALTGSLQRMVVPRSYFVSLPETGTYVIFHEYQGSVAGKVFATRNVNLSGLRVSVVGKATGEHVKVKPSTTTYSYSSGSAGISVAEFDIRKPGIYQLSAWYERGTGPDVVLAIGKGAGDTMWGVIVRGLAILFTATGLALLTGLAVFVKRRKALRRPQPLPDAAEAVPIEPT